MFFKWPLFDIFEFGARDHVKGRRIGRGMCVRAFTASDERRSGERECHDRISNDRDDAVEAIVHAPTTPGV